MSDPTARLLHEHAKALSPDLRHEAPPAVQGGFALLAEMALLAHVL
jgi:hypothetical protein